MTDEKTVLSASKQNAAMSKKEVYDLLNKAKNGDEEAREKLILENTGLVNMAARKFTASGYEFDDLMQIGYIGLIKAIDRFEPEYDVMFSTYAVPMIIGEIRRFLRDDGRMKMSRQLKQNVKLMKQAEEKFIQEHGRSPRISELAQEMGCSRQEIAEMTEARNILNGIMSIDDESFYSGPSQPMSEENENRKAELIDLKSIIGNLKEKERSVIILRYFEDMTQQQTGKMLGISQVQVSRIEKKVLASMRESMYV